MRWLSFAVLAWVAIVLQTTLVPRLPFGNIRPDLLYIIAVHYSLHAVSPDAMIAAWLLGFTMDICGPGTIGVFAFSYGLTSLIIVRLRDSMFRDHPLTWTLVTLVSSWLVYLIVGVHFLLTHPTAQRGIADVLTHSILTAAITAFFAPYIQGFFGRIRTVLGLMPAHRLRMHRMI